jgi:hypothetical protein
MNDKRGDDDTGVGYDWRGHSSSTRSNLLELLRSDKMMDLVNKGKLKEVVGCVFKWEHILVLQLGSSKWTREGVDQWIDVSEFKCVIRTNIEGDAVCHTHEFVRCFKVTATNSLQTKNWKKHQLIVQEMKGWGNWAQHHNHRSRRRITKRHGGGVNEEGRVPIQG